LGSTFHKFHSRK